MTDTPIPLMRPYIPPRARTLMDDVLASGFLTEGEMTTRFEKMVATFTGAAHAVAVTSATVGLEVALRALSIGPGDEVIIPDYTYPATVDAVLRVGAAAVVVDIDPGTMLMDMDAMATAITPRTKAVMPVSAFGNPLNYHALRRITEPRGLPIVEDAAPSLGSGFEGTKTGALADLTVFSFHPRKPITTGEGGMITLGEAARADWIRSYKRFGLEQDAAGGLVFAREGTNYKLSNLLAALGVAQMEEIDKILQRRHALALAYRSALSTESFCRIPSITEAGTHAWQSFCIFVENRDALIPRMKEEGIEVQVGTYAMHRIAAFRAHDRVRFCGEMTTSATVFNETLTLPLYHGMTASEQERVLDSLRRCCR